MKAKYVAGVEEKALLDPTASVWSQAGAETLKMEGTQAALQPTEVIRVAWEGKKIGAIENVKCQAIHNGETLAFRLEWKTGKPSTDHGDNTLFPDGCAVAFPAHVAAPLVTMGAIGFPVNAWHWRADAVDTGHHVSAEGLGTTEAVDQDSVKTNGSYQDGSWVVVIARALKIETEKVIAQLEPGTEAMFGVAIWSGADQERGGIKAISGLNWLNLSLEAGE